MNTGTLPITVLSGIGPNQYSEDAAFKLSATKTPSWPASPVWVAAGAAWPTNVRNRIFCTAICRDVRRWSGTRGSAYIDAASPARANSGSFSPWGKAVALHSTHGGGT